MKWWKRSKERQEVKQCREEIGKRDLRRDSRVVGLSGGAHVLKGSEYQYVAQSRLKKSCMYYY